jgi:hypothetical protein
LQASPRETSEFLIEKGRRDARAWAVAMGLDALLPQVNAGVDGAGADAGAGAGGAQGLAGEPRTDTDPLHDSPPTPRAR